MTTAKTTAERQQAFRARRAADGLVEVRGVFTRALYIGGLCAAVVATLAVSRALRWWRRGGGR